ncbi:hypothetical protein QY886_02350 [Latilactobacillus sakei]
MLGITAYNTLMHFTNFKHGDTIAIMGASGAVGSLLTQLSLVCSFKRHCNCTQFKP